MNFAKVKFVVLLLIVGLLSACAAPATEAPDSAPTESSAPVISSPQGTEALTSLPAATATFVLAAESSPTAEAAAGGATVSFAHDIQPIIESRCINCHGGNRTEEGLSLKTYADIMAGSKNGSVVTKRGPKLTPPQVQLIVNWIDQGALDN